MRRKRIANNILNEMPELKDNQVIMRSLGPKGKNIHEAELPDGTVTLVTLPPKFRNLVWIKRGKYFLLPILIIVLILLLSLYSQNIMIIDFRFL